MTGAAALLAPLTSHANSILFMDPVITNSCLNVCPDVTSGLADGLFHLVGPTTLRGAMVATFEVPGSYQGGQMDWSIGAVGSSTPLFTGTLLPTQWDEGAVTVSGISLEEYYENFSLGSGVVLMAGNYYLQISDPSTPPDRFGIFWATNDTGLAFSLEGSGNQAPPPPATPELGSSAMVAVGLGAIAWWARKRRRQPSL